MLETRILVTGAAGTTGSYVVRFLRSMGLPVRALIQTLDERSQRLEDQGAELMIGDLLDLESVRGALEGIDRAYFVFPIRPGLLQATAFFAQVAEENGLEVIVNMSQRCARHDATSLAAQCHWVAETLLNRCGVPVVHLAPTLFAEWLLTLSFMVNEGHIRFPFGSGRHAAITASDLGRVIAAILADPAPHIGRRYPLSGPVEMTHSEMATAIGAVLEREISYEQIDFEAFVAIARHHGADFPPFLVQHLREVVIDHQKGLLGGVNDLVRSITGVAAQTIGEFAQVAFGERISQTRQ